MPISNLNCCQWSSTKNAVCLDDERDKTETIVKNETRKYSKRPSQKILLLGTGESGKSTFLKQMRIICGKPFTQSEKESFKSIIYNNIYKGVLYLLQVLYLQFVKFGVHLRGIFYFGVYFLITP